MVMAYDDVDADNSDKHDGDSNLSSERHHKIKGQERKKKHVKKDSRTEETPIKTVINKWRRHKGSKGEWWRTEGRRSEGGEREVAAGERKRAGGRQESRKGREGVEVSGRAQWEDEPWDERTGRRKGEGGRGKISEGK